MSDDDLPSIKQLQILLEHEELVAKFRATGNRDAIITFLNATHELGRSQKFLTGIYHLHTLLNKM